jgi:hypothetical protein
MATAILVSGQNLTEPKKEAKNKEESEFEIPVNSTTLTNE